MYAFLTAGPVLPFTVALALMLAIALVELIGFLVGHAASQVVDGLLHVDTHAHLEVDASGVGHALEWLHVGRVPILILVVLALACFGGVGVLLQAGSLAAFGWLLPGWLASLVALPLALPVLRVAGGVIGRILPRDETSVVSRDDLVGLSAEIVLGEARAQSPAQARTYDRHRLAHYVMVVPARDDDVLAAGEPLILIARDGTRYRAVREADA